MNRKKFVKSSASFFGSMLLFGSADFVGAKNNKRDPTTVGIIGLDTPHATAFTDLINKPQGSDSTGFKVIAVYPYGSRTIEESINRIPVLKSEIIEKGVEVVESIEELVDRVDVVINVTNDGHPRLEQSLKVLEAGKSMFIDKPFAASLTDVKSIIEASKQHNVPIFSSSSLRYLEGAQQIRHNNAIGDVYGVDAYSPSPIEETHPDLFWYGIHGVEILFTVLGRGCRTVHRTKTGHTDVVVGVWENGRVGTLRGIRGGRRGFGGIAFGSEAILDLGVFEGYGPLVDEILEFFRTDTTPVDLEETLEIYAFMEAADESIKRGGTAVALEEVIAKA